MSQFVNGHCDNECCSKTAIDQHYQHRLGIIVLDRRGQPGIDGAMRRPTCNSKGLKIGKR